MITGRDDASSSQLSRAVAVFGVALLSLLPLAVCSQETGTASAAKQDSRWEAIGRALGRKGAVEQGYYRVNFPRRDLTVRNGDHTLAPAFELTSYFGFVPTSGGRVMAMGELVLREDELRATDSRSQVWAAGGTPADV